jgi:hypothetical protein
MRVAGGGSINGINGSFQNFFVLNVMQDSGAQNSIYAAGNIKTDGNINIGTSGKGISFGASSNFSGMSSEVLDDYEEGTCTMTLENSSANCTITEGNGFTAYYTKIGRKVTITGYTGTRTITNAGSGIAKISGMPFNPMTSAYSVVNMSHNTMFTTTNEGYTEPNTNDWYPIASHTTGGVGYPTGAKVFMFTVTYLAS